MPQGFFSESEMYSKRPVSLIPQCGSCGLYKKCKSPKMPVDGDGERKILIVGEAPGEQEDKKNKPFVGPTGQLLEKTLKTYGIDMRRDCWMTNTLICRPPDNRTPSDSEVEYCRPNIVKAIETLKPHIIVPLGGAAVDSVIGWVWKDRTEGIGRWIGWNIPCQKLNAWICPAWHPSYVSRQDTEKKNPEVKVIWKSHLKAISELSGRPWKKVPDYPSQVTIILDPEEASRHILGMIEKGGVAAFDYETNCLKPDWDEAEIVSASICLNGDWTIAFPWTGPVIPAFGRFLRSKIKKIASNFKFEDRWSRRFFGRPVRNWWWCTMTGGHVHDNRRGITGIKFQSFVWLGADSYDDHIKPLLRSQGDSKINRVIKEIELRDLLLYNGLDSLLEYHTAFAQRKALGYEDQ